jgi:hypothetical protein
MGGLISLYGFLQHPTVFGLCGAFSPVFWYGNDALYQFVSSHATGRGRVYLDVGGKEGEIYMALATDKQIKVANADNAYRDGVRRFLGLYPRTLRGFHDRGRHAVVVNLAAGPSTLRHELAHPLIEAMHPSLPAWVDEGLAGLFEHVGPEGRPVGGPPLHRLAKRMDRGHVPRLSALTAATETQFYQDPQHLNYLLARAAMLYAHRQNRLGELVAALAVSSDATGYTPLCEVLAGGDPDRLEADVGRFVRAWPSSVAQGGR